MNPIELLAVIFGFICVYLTIKESIWCWPAGLIQVSLYIFVFYDARLYSDVILHIIYVFMNLYGWYFWLHGGNKKQEARVTRLSPQWLTISLAISLTATVLLGYLMASRTDASFPYGDAFTTAFSLTAQWLMSRKKLESWHFWIAVDMVAIGIYAAKDLDLTAGLYIAFLFMAIAGYFRWKKSLQSSQTEFAAADLETAT